MTAKKRKVGWQPAKSHPWRKETARYVERKAAKAKKKEAAKAARKAKR